MYIKINVGITNFVAFTPPMGGGVHVVLVTLWRESERERERERGGGGGRQKGVKVCKRINIKIKQNNKSDIY